MQFSAPFVYDKSEETESIDLSSILVELRQFFTICRWSSFQVPEFHQGSIISHQNS
ncbi:unnamed protein product [Brassica napus]|uniref:(rape) hypothetical protein n=1 Tax=Brassica napus TaxID=3708 RepID=A0A816YL18_BRANA|nr:unnamed protein product [Brassica napus]